MLIPIGHDHGNVRRWPYATFVVMLICIAVYGSHHIELRTAQDVRIETYLQAADYLAEHPWLEVSDDFVLPRSVTEELALIRRQVTGQIDLTVLKYQQLELEKRLAAWRDSLHIGPIRELGYSPAHPELQKLVTSLFMHGGVGHLVGNMLILFLAGPALEDRWGRPFFLGFYLLGGLVSTLVHAFLDPRPLLPLVGASGAIAALMGASLLKFWRARLLFLLWIPPFFKRVSLPAVVVLLAWALHEVAASWLIAQAPHAAPGVANLAHVGGFFFGIAFAAGVQALGIEKRFLEPRVSKTLGEVTNSVLVEVHELLDRGRKNEAWSMLERRLAQAPEDADLVLAFWHLAVDLGRTEPAGKRLVRFVRSTLRNGDCQRSTDALQFLSELEYWQPDLAVAPRERLGLAEDLASAGFEDQAADLVESLRRIEHELTEEARTRLRLLTERLVLAPARSFVARSQSSEPAGWHARQS